MKGENAKREIGEGLDAIRSVAGRAVEIKTLAETFGKPEKIYAVGCGSSLAAGYAIAFWLRQSGFDAEAIPSSEFYSYNHHSSPQTLAIFLSQSGKTTETVFALRHAKSLGMDTFSISNFPDSPLALEAGKTFSLNLQKEIAVMATKTVDATLAAGYAFAQSLAGREFSKLDSVISVLERIITTDMGGIADFIKPYRSIYIVGSGLDYAGVMEFSIKIGEGALIQATPMYTLEVSHGPKAAASDLPAVIIALQPNIQKDYARIIREVKENRTKTVSLSRPGMDLGADLNFEIDIDPELSVFAIVKFSQVLTLNLGLSKDVDPDAPPSLKKVVILEH